MIPISPNRSRSQPSRWSSNPQLLAVGNDLGEDQVLEALLGPGRRKQRLDFFVRHAERRPQFGIQRAAAHQIARLVGELLALPERIGRQVVVDLLEREDAEGHVPGLVGHDVADHLLEQRVLGRAHHHAERRQGEAFDHDLHAEVHEVPLRVLEQLVEQGLEVLVDRIGGGHLLIEVPVERLDMASLVDHLGGGVVLGVNPWHRLDQAGGAHEGPLLAVQELAQRGALGVDGEVDPAVLVPVGDR